jgi:hypothetical protein
MGLVAGLVLVFLCLALRSTPSRLLGVQFRPGRKRMKRRATGM